MKTYRIVEGERASPFFVDSLSKSGLRGPEAYCGFCGRTHYSVDDAYAYHEDADYEDNDRYSTCITEKEGEKLLKENPNGVVLNTTGDFFELACINGIDIVIDCPCNGLRNYEDFIWKNKNEIRKYLKSRIEQEAIWAEQQLIINRLAGI